MGNLALLVLLVSLVTGGSGRVEKIIGIDFGTMYSSVAVFMDGNVEVIANDHGNTIMPSYVAFTEDGRKLVGEPALDQLPENSGNTIFNIKRIIGRSFDDKFVQEDLKYADYKLINKRGKPHFTVTTSNGERTYTPEEVAAMVLSKLKETAEVYLGESVRKAVITVPAFFNDAQRQATKDAGTIAGLKVLEVINEPTAAALAYGIKKNIEMANVLVLDFGGGTVDATIFKIDDGVYQVAATNGNTSLGGEDLNKLIIDYFVELFKRHKEIDFNGDRVLYQKIRPFVEKAKCSLSFGNYAWVEIPEFALGADFTEPFYRIEFEEMGKDIFESVMELIKSVLEDSELDKRDIDDIVLVGGSSRIPILQKMIKKFFNGREYLRGIDPDETVAYGAAVHAARLTGEDTTQIKVVDVNPLTLGIEIMDSIMSPMIKKNSQIPAKKSQIFSTVVDNQEMITFRVFEGERPLTKDNHYLGEFILRLPMAPRGVPQIEVTFEINTDGILHISARDTATGRIEKLRISSDNQRLSKSDINRMIEESADIEEEDRKLHEWLNIKNNFEYYAFDMKGRIHKQGSKLSQKDKDFVERAIEKKLKWLAKNQDAPTHEIEAQKRDMENLVDPVISKLTRDEL